MLSRQHVLRSLYYAHGQTPALYMHSTTSCTRMHQAPQDGTPMVLPLSQVAQLQRHTTEVSAIRHDGDHDSAPFLQLSDQNDHLLGSQVPRPGPALPLALSSGTAARGTARMSKAAVAMVRAASCACDEKHRVSHQLSHCAV